MTGKLQEMVSYELVSNFQQGLLAGGYVLIIEKIFFKWSIEFCLRK